LYYEGRLPASHEVKIKALYINNGVLCIHPLAADLKTGRFFIILLKNIR